MHNYIQCKYFQKACIDMKRIMLQCDIDGCSRTFTTVYNLNTHKRLHYRPCINECPLESCRQRFPTKKQLDLHLREHENDVEKPYK